MNAPENIFPWKFLICTLCFCLPVFPCHAQQTLSGGVALTEPLGARQCGMAESATALAGDVSGLAFNPAGLSELDAPAVTSMMASGLFDYRTTLLAFGMPIVWQGKNALALSLMNLAGPEMTLYAPDGSTETRISQNDLVMVLGLARKLSGTFALGCNIKYFHSVLIEDYTASTAAFDFGAHLAPPQIPGLQIGCALQNLGAEVAYVSQADPLPTTLRMGAAYVRSLWDGQRLLMSLDALFPNDQEPLQHLGLEYAWQETLFLRAGYKLGYDIDTFSLGAGIVFYGVRLDYAFSNTQLEMAQHRVSLTYVFSRP